MDTQTGGRYDNSSVVERVHSINSVTNGRRFDIFLDSNMEEINLSRRFALSHIMGDISISGDVSKSTSQLKLLALLTRNTPKR